jgi:hypothetical protein
MAKRTDIRPGEIPVSEDILREIELRLQDHEKLVQQLRHLLALARGGLQERPIIEPTPSRLGLKSKCVELSRKPRPPPLAIEGTLE